MPVLVKRKGREHQRSQLQREGTSAWSGEWVASGWRVRKCHFRELKHLRAVKNFPLARLACGQPGEAHLDVGLID